MYYVGVDLHKESSWFYVMDESGKRVMSENVSNSPDVLNEFFQRISSPFYLAVEATYNWYFFVDIAEKYADEVYLANSYELKAYAKRHKKTDKIDAHLIADVLRKGYLPTVTIPGKHIRSIKEYLHYRMNLVSDRSRYISRLKSVLDKLGLPSSGDFTTYKRLNLISVEGLSEYYQKVICGYIENIRYLNRQIYQTEKMLEKIGEFDPDIRNLKTIPGIGDFSGALIKSEIIDINRFRSFNRLCAYAGLAPRVSKSSHKIFRGPLNKNRRKALQWILIEVAHHYIKGLSEKKKKYERIAKRKSRNTAKVCLARDLLKIIYHVLKEKRPFYLHKEEQIRSVAASALCGV